MPCMEGTEIWQHGSAETVHHHGHCFNIRKYGSQRLQCKGLELPAASRTPRFAHHPRLVSTSATGKRGDQERVRRAHRLQRRCDSSRRWVRKRPKYQGRGGVKTLEGREGSGHRYVLTSHRHVLRFFQPALCGISRLPRAVWVADNHVGETEARFVEVRITGGEACGLGVRGVTLTHHSKKEAEG